MNATCPRCGDTFAGLALFDRHHSVNYNRTPPILCRDPARFGMVRASTGTWTTPEGREKIDRMSALGRSRKTS